MQDKPSSSVTAFVAVAVFLVAWRFAPGPESDPMRWMLAGPFAIAGLLLVLIAVRGAERRPSPWPGALGKLIWLLRPRSWMLAWAAIVVAAGLFGTPHLLFEYPPRTRGDCVYVGIWGAQRTPANGGGLNGCRLATLLHGQG